MIINTNRLQLRPLDKRDINAYFNIAQGDGIEEYAYHIYVDSKEKAKARIEAFQSLTIRSDDYMFAIEEKANKALIGVISVTKILGNLVDISLFIAESCRSRGYAKEAVNALIYKFVEMKKEYILDFFVANDNYPASMFMRKIKTEAKKQGYEFVEKRIVSGGTDHLLKL